MERIEFFFDLGSPWSYLASTQLDGLAARTGAEVVWRPFLLGGVFKATGNQSPAYEKVENKLAYFYDDLHSWATLYRVPFQVPSVFPPNTLTAMRGAIAATRLGRPVAFARAGFEAYFAEDRNISDSDVVVDVATRIGLDVAQFQTLINDVDTKEALKRATSESLDRGAFGAPTFFWRDRMFFGNDRLGLLEALINEG
ncbi:MAG: 2-hydroxychromene-2-carboxylate isomerase [Pseudomonadota bacterium]